MIESSVHEGRALRLDSKEMLLSVLFYCGAAAILAGAGAALPRRTRRKGLAFAGGMASVTIAIFWPVSEEHAAEVHSHLDEIVPRWQFAERHEIRIDASPERIFEAIRDVTPREIRLFQTLTAIRRLGGDGGRESIINAPEDEPLLAVATRTGFRVLVDDAPRELVFGTHVAPGSSAVMNFQIEDGGLLTTETRVVLASSGATRRLFAAYWRVIRPGSGIIRRSWLEAIKRRAEASRHVRRR